MKSALIIAALSVVQAATKTAAEIAAAKKAAANNTISASVPMNSMTITIGIIFILQLLFCFGICVYTNGQVQKAEKNATTQQAEFYQFLY